MQNFLEFLVVKLEECTRLGEEGFRIKDGLLFILEKLALLLRKDTAQYSTIETIMQEFAFPLLQSENGIERYRACKLYEELSM